MQTAFQNQNQYINYPFRENATLYDTFGGLRLWPKVIVDFVVYGVDPERKYYLARTEWLADSNQLIMVFQDDLGNGFAQITVTIYPLTKTVYGVYSFTSADDLIKGRVIIDKYAAYQIWGGMSLDTTNYFTPEATEFEPGTIVPLETAVLSINQYGYTRYYKGDVKLKEGHNIRLDQDSTGITITAEQNAGKGPVCADSEICHAKIDPDRNGTNTKLCGLDRAVMKLGGAVAGDNCDIVFAGNDCIRILKYPNEHMIAFYNECTEICSEQALFNDIVCRLCKIEERMGLAKGGCDTVCNATEPPAPVSDPGPGVPGVIETIPETHLPYVHDLFRNYTENYSLGTDMGLVCKHTQQLRPGDERIIPVYTSTRLAVASAGCPPIATAQEMLNAHYMSKSAAEAAGFYVLNNRDEFQLSFSPANKTIPLVGMSLFWSPLYNMGLEFYIPPYPQSDTEGTWVKGKINFSLMTIRMDLIEQDLRMLGAPPFKETGVIPVRVQVLPYHDKYSGTQNYDWLTVKYYAWRYLVMRGWPGFPVV